MKRTFIKSDHQTLFEKQGYIIVKNFISTEEIKYLRDIYEETQNVVQGKKFFISQWSDNKELKFKINDAVQKVILQKAQSFLDDYVPVFGVFGVKHPGKGSEMYLHGDWTHVDETKYRTVNVWTPLLDINRKNGAICLLKGSNRLFNFIRGAEIPDAFRNLGEKKLKPFLTDIYLEAGDAIMWDHCVIHGSRENSSKSTRVAAVLNLRPRDSEFYLFFASSKTNPEFIDVYKPPQDFFLQSDSANKPNLIKEASELIDRIPYVKPEISLNKVEEFLKNEFPEVISENKKFLNKLRLRFRLF